MFGIKCPNLIDHGLILGCKWSVQHAPSLDTFSSQQFATPFFDCHDVVVNCCFLVTGLLSFFPARTLPIFSRMPTVGDCHMVMSISPSRLTVHACLGWVLLYWRQLCFGHEFLWAYACSVVETFMEPSLSLLICLLGSEKLGIRAVCFLINALFTFAGYVSDFSSFGASA
jgi:hypothetical protein